MDAWKLVGAGILILFGFNLLAYGYAKRRIAAAKAEGYKRQREASADGSGGGFFYGSETLPHKTDIWARDVERHGNMSSSTSDDGSVGDSGSDGGDSGGNSSD